MAVAKNRVILGMMTFGPPTVTSARITEISETKRILQMFKDRGYCELDTARVYMDGEQEAFTAKAGYKDYGFTIATKCYPALQGEHSPERLTEFLNTSLKELNTNSVEVYYLHAPDRKTPILDTLKTMDKLHKEGKFKIFGISNYAAYEVTEMVDLARQYGLVQPTLYQARYNCITRVIEPELIPALRRYGIDIVVYNPLAGGLLSGKYGKTAQPTEGRFDLNSTQGSVYRSRYFKEAYWDALDIIEEAVSKHAGISLIEVALRWVANHSLLKLGPAAGQTGDGIIIGISSYEQLMDNLDALEKGPLPQDIVDALDKAARVASMDAQPYWLGKLEYSYQY
ncbi:NADP-dependent oxidoreductase domain-containing protein [Lipomyces oligophaga]|uniref:NADP-dependent oxidoreductase domain-containing protein n=1 Tax=Lipomyces oligophaga TaxID=45792 RepID=UPI0034CDDCC4